MKKEAVGRAPVATLPEGSVVLPHTLPFLGEVIHDLDLEEVVLHRMTDTLVKENVKFSDHELKLIF